MSGRSRRRRHEQHHDGSEEEQLVSDKCREGVFSEKGGGRSQDAALRGVWKRQGAVFPPKGYASVVSFAVLSVHSPC